MDHSGQTIGKYKLIKRLGQGGMAQVYQAIQPTIDRPVAVKLMHGHLAENEDFLVRFKREAKGMGLLRHPNIVSILDFDNEGDLYYMVMDYIEGMTLQTYLGEHAPLEPVQSLQITRQLASALAYAHHRGTVHRDIKPANVMFTDNTCTDVVLTDFGIARLMDDVNVTQSGTISGTPAYMSPEAAQGARVDDRADIYSLGIILYEMVTGKPPFGGDTPIAVIMQHVTAPLPAPSSVKPDIPDSVERIIARCLAKKPAERFPSAASLVSAIDRAIAEIQGGMSTVQGTLSQFDGGASAGDQTAVQPSIATTSTEPQAAATAVAPKTPPPDPASLKPLERPEPVATKPAPRPRWPLVAGGLLLILCIVATATAAIFYFQGLDDETVTAVAGNDAATTTPSVTPAATAAEIEPTIVAETPVPVIDPTDEPAATATAPATEAAQPFAEPGRIGTARLASLDGVLASQLVVAMDGVARPPAGFHYEVWLLGGSTVRVGELQVADGVAIGGFPLDSSGLATFDTVLVTLEADDSAATAPSAQVIYQGSTPPNMSEPVLSLLNSTGSVTLAQAQMDLAIQHAGFALDSLSSGDFGTGRTHAEHVVNILDGNDGDFPDDLDGDGVPQNPGDGVGVRLYLQQTNDLLTTIGAQGDLTVERQQLVAQALAASAGAQLWQGRAVNAAISIIASDTVEEAAGNGEQLVQALANMRFAPAPVPNEPDSESFAGLQQHLLGVLAVPLFAVEASGVPVGSASLAPGISGYARLSDNESSPAGSILIVMDHLAAPVPGSAYFAWLETSDGDRQPLGDLTILGGLAFLARETGQNMFVIGASVLITSQPIETGTEFAGPALFVAELATPEREAIAPIFGGPAVGPGLAGLATTQLALAQEHAGFMNDALAAGDLSGAQRHAEHVINILAGEENRAFGDRDGSGLAENPGDGVGVLAYLEAIGAVGDGLGGGTQRLPAQRAAAGRLSRTVVNQTALLREIIDQLEPLFSTDLATSGLPIATATLSGLEQLRRGADLDSNGVIDPLLSEAGVIFLGDLALDVAQASFTPADE